MLKRLTLAVLALLVLGWAAGSLVIALRLNPPETLQATPQTTPIRASPTAMPAPTATSVATLRPAMPIVGQEAHVWTDGLPEIHLSVDRAARDEWNKSVVANDIIGIRQLIARGRAFPVSDGTRVLVLEQDWFDARVRILEGRQSGRAGWLAHENVR